jgi:hypothetical protein
MKFQFKNLSQKNITIWSFVVAIFATLIALGAWLLPDPLRNIFNPSPSYEINILNLPNKEEAVYYVTDALIRTKGDLSAFPDFKISPLNVEVVPHYSGNKKYGNVVLRVSGGGLTKDYKLWADFEKSSQTQTVTIELADILSISGIKENRLETGTNLMLGKKPYQEAELKFEVIRLAAPEKPMSPVVKLPVKNTPWKQEVKVIQRDGLVIDYALTNYGGKATFYCIVNIASALSDKNENDDPFWSGTKIFNYGPNCQPFTLNNGETYQVSFRLDTNTLGKEFLHGRYFVEVYTIMERTDIVFNAPHSYENSNELWLMANQDNVDTFVICNDPGKTCAQSVTLPIEQVRIKVDPYSSNDQLGNGSTYFWVQTYQVDSESKNQYILDYWIDPQKDGWIGFAINFLDSIDATTFTSIQFKIKLDESMHPFWVELTSTDSNGKEFKKRILLGDGTYGNKSVDEQIITIPINAFQGIDPASISAINFVADSNMVPNTEHHELQVSEVKFIR